MHNAHLTGTGSAVPQRILNNQDLERIVDTSNEWILRRTGIEERRISNKYKKESTTDLGSQAAMAAMEMAKLNTVLYVSGEESERQIKMRAVRLLRGKK